MNRSGLFEGFVAVTLLSISTVGWADTFVIPLQVNGHYTIGIDQQAPFEFDLGVALLEVQEVRFACRGTITAGLDYWGEPFSWSFSAKLSSVPGHWFAYGPEAGEATWPAPEPFEGESSFRPLRHATWDFLLDGHATGWVELSLLFFYPETPPQQPPSGYLETASLTVEATPIPEPATIMLLGLGAIALRKCRG